MRSHLGPCSCRLVPGVCWLTARRRGGPFPPGASRGWGCAQPRTRLGSCLSLVLLGVHGGRAGREVPLPARTAPNPFHLVALSPKTQPTRWDGRSGGIVTVALLFFRIVWILAGCGPLCRGSPALPSSILSEQRTELMTRWTSWGGAFSPGGVFDSTAHAEILMVWPAPEQAPAPPSCQRRRPNPKSTRWRSRGGTFSSCFCAKS